MRLFRTLIKNIPGVKATDRFLRRHYTGGTLKEPFPRGHYYSPLPDIADVRQRAGELFRTDIKLGDDIDLRESTQLVLLERFAREYYAEFDWPEHPLAERRYYYKNEFFGIGDGFGLYSIMREFQPRHVVEIGSGFSSALMLDVNDRFCGSRADFMFVEPDPFRLSQTMRSGDEGRCTLLRAPVQSVPMSCFEVLGENDILFIDSSHVSKLGSDVNHLFFRILPKLAAGVIVHVHDVPWPFEYPESYALEGVAWNEAYLLRAFLQYNVRFQILFWMSALARKHRQRFEMELPRCLHDVGGSIWLRKL